MKGEMSSRGRPLHLASLQQKTITRDLIVIVVIVVESHTVHVVYGVIDISSTE